MSLWTGSDYDCVYRGHFFFVDWPLLYYCHARCAVQIGFLREAPISFGWRSPRAGELADTLGKFDFREILNQTVQVERESLLYPFVTIRRILQFLQGKKSSAFFGEPRFPDRVAIVVPRHFPLSDAT